MPETAKWLFIVALILIFAGFLWWGWSHFQLPSIPLGRLPGDFRWETSGGKVYFPLTTCILLSGILSMGMWLVKKAMSLF